MRNLGGLSGRLRKHLTIMRVDQVSCYFVLYDTNLHFFSLLHGQGYASPCEIAKCSEVTIWKTHGIYLPSDAMPAVKWRAIHGTGMDTDWKPWKGLLEVMEHWIQFQKVNSYFGFETIISPQRWQQMQSGVKFCDQCDVVEWFDLMEWKVSKRMSFAGCWGYLQGQVVHSLW